MMENWLRNFVKMHSSGERMRRIRKLTRGNSLEVAKEAQDMAEVVKDTVEEVDKGMAVVEVECLRTKGQCKVILSRTSSSTHRRGLPRLIRCNSHVQVCQVVCLPKECAQVALSLVDLLKECDQVVPLQVACALQEVFLPAEDLPQVIQEISLATH